MTTIIIASTHKYCYIWNPFFDLLKKFWPDHPEVYFMSDGSPEYLADKYQIRVFNVHKDLGFLETYEYLLDFVKTPTVILLQEDFLIERPVNKELINDLIETFKTHKDIGYIRCTPCPGPKGNAIQYPKVMLGLFHPQQDYLFSFQATIWRVSFLSQLLQGYQHRSTILNIEKDLTQLLSRTSHKLLGIIRTDNSPDGVFQSPIPYRPTAIIKGQIQPWAIELIKKHQIN